MVIDHFKSESEQILSELESYPRSLFLHLKTIFEVHLSGTLDFTHMMKSDTTNVPSGRSENVHMQRLKTYLEKVSDFPRFLRNNPVDLTDNMIERYLEVCTCSFTYINSKYTISFLQPFETVCLHICLTAYL